MTKEKKVSQAEQALEQQLGELMLDLQRTRADFENYRKRVDVDMERARETGRRSTILKLLPVVDNIERALAHTPKELADNKWAQGVSNLVKSLEKSLELLGVRRIEASAGTVFNPELHEAIQAEDGEGEEIVSEELQAGYTVDDEVIRPSLVKVRFQ